MLVRKLWIAFAIIFDLASAATSVSNEQMVRWLSAGGVDLAVAYAPLWFMGQSQDQPPCMPTWTHGGTPDIPDVYDDAHKIPGGDLCIAPNVGCNCRNPGINTNNTSPPFPVYYTFQQCNDTQIRVAYNLFYQKDGAVVTGHAYDWERVIVIHQRGTDGQWSPDQILLSQHSKYQRLKWGDIKNTLTTEEINQGKAKEPEGVKNNDHPKVYISWSKHANYDSRNTAWIDPLSQSLGNAYRSQDWWYFVEPKYYIRADNSTTAGQVIGKADWGGCNNPLKIQAGICSA